MRQNRTLFFAIIALAVVVLIGMVLAYFYVPAVGPQQVSIQVVVAPSIKPWVDQAALEFNETNRTAQVEIVTANELIPTSRFRASDAQTTLPAAWLAETSSLVDLARDDGLDFGDAQSVASTSLSWGAYDDKLGQLEQDYGPLSWQTLNAKATNPNDMLKLVIASPQNTAEGIAALVSATAAHGDKQSISGDDVSAANQWLIDTLGDRKAQTPPTPAASFASIQGRTLGDAGILSLASWRSAGLDRKGDFTLIPVEPNVVLDYPYVIWTGRQSSAESQQAATAFRSFLLSQAQQNALANFYLDQAVTADVGVQADGVAVQRLLDWTDRELR